MSFQIWRRSPQSQLLSETIALEENIVTVNVKIWRCESCLSWRANTEVRMLFSERQKCELMNRAQTTSTNSPNTRWLLLNLQFLLWNIFPTPESKPNPIPTEIHVSATPSLTLLTTRGPGGSNLGSVARPEGGERPGPVWRPGSDRVSIQSNLQAHEKSTPDNRQFLCSAASRGMTCLVEVRQGGEMKRRRRRRRWSWFSGCDFKRLCSKAGTLRE